MRYPARVSVPRRRRHSGGEDAALSDPVPARISAGFRRLPPRLRRLARKLRVFFGLNDDPFEYDEELKGWKALFRAEPDLGAPG